jgi:tetratricopeptide (TPR) repeat protein
MKYVGKLTVIIIGFLALAASAYAQPPREQLNQMVQQLQKSPNDNALREKIIKLVLTLKPSPALSPEAERRMVRGGAAFNGATSVADYRAAAKEFEHATLAAPWYGEAYFNLGVAQDKAEDFDAALLSLKFAALASPGNKDAEKLSYAVEFRKEKAAGPEARAAKQKLKDEALMKSLEGAVFTMNVGPGLYEDQWRLSGGQVTRWHRRLLPSGCLCNEDNRCSGPIGEEGMCSMSLALNGRRGERRDGSVQIAIEIAEDGRSLLMRWVGSRHTSEDTYLRR